MNHLDVLLPFALPPAEISSDLIKQLHTPSLATLLARGKSTALPMPDGFLRALPHELWLARQFGVDSTQGAPAAAQLLMRTLSLAPDAGFWFVLQPVHIHIARDHLVLADPRQLALDEADARILFDIARPLFEEAGHTLVYGDAGTWFLRADEWHALHTTTPDAAAGHNIDIWMPKGEGERAWRKVQNEVQMHWFNHPVNETREVRRMKPVNSLWLWGGAANAEACAPYDTAANLSGWTHALAPTQWHDTADALLAAPGQHALLLLDQLLEPAISTDWGSWLACMQALENSWFAPLLQALKAGRLEQLSLVLGGDTRLVRTTITRTSLRKFWVKPALATLCP